MHIGPAELTRKKHPSNSFIPTPKKSSSNDLATPFVIIASDVPHENFNNTATNRSKKYGGRYVVWPGALLLSIIAIAAVVLVYIGAIHTDQSEGVRSKEQLNNIRERRAINDGGQNDGVKIDIADDGEVGNPKSYPPRDCVLPNYVSRDNKIYARYSDVQEPIVIKGINWFGMETKHAIPYGLWQNDDNGTTVYEIATFLAKNKFNSVRLPLSISHILKNSIPDASFINQASNRAIIIKDYIRLTQSIIKGLGHRSISVLLDFHTLTPSDKGPLWYSRSVPESKVLEAIDIMTSSLCSDTYWNVIGLDLKNEPSGAKWGNGAKATDFLI